MRTPLFPWFILWVTIPIIIFFLFILPAHASEGPFYQRGQEGWFWYQVIPEPAESEEFIKVCVRQTTHFNLFQNP